MVDIPLGVAEEELIFGCWDPASKERKKKKKRDCVVL